jgi:hypothetical protein
MNPISSPSAIAPVPPRRRRVWPWVLGLGLAPFVVLGLAAVSYLTLDRDAAVLRRHVMRATDADWSTKVQFSVGRLTLGCIRTGLGWIEHKDAANVRLALDAVQHASVGVYELGSDAGRWSNEKLLLETDRAMQQRGWSRLVGVSGRKETVLIYTADALRDHKPIDLCLAVVEGRKLVIVSASVNAEALGQLVEHHAPGDLKGKLQRQMRTAAR